MSSIGSYVSIMSGGWFVSSGTTNFTADMTDGWWTDETIAASAILPGTDLGVESSAFKLLQNLVSWTTRQKDRVNFSLPVTADYVQLELLQPVQFRDVIFTNNIVRKGWIEFLELDPSKGQINIGLILEPADIEYPSGLIIERGLGLNIDTITESGTNSNIIIEGGV